MCTQHTQLPMKHKKKVKPQKKFIHVITNLIYCKYIFRCALFCLFPADCSFISIIHFLNLFRPKIVVCRSLLVYIL